MFQIVCTDRVRLLQVLNNPSATRSNSLEKGGVRIHCRSGRLWSADASFEVRDTGVGVLTEKRTEIFEELVQADPATRAPGGIVLPRSASGWSWRSAATLALSHLKVQQLCPPSRVVVVSWRRTNPMRCCCKFTWRSSAHWCCGKGSSPSSSRRRRGCEPEGQSDWPRLRHRRRRNVRHPRYPHLPGCDAALGGAFNAYLARQAGQN